MKSLKRFIAIISTVALLSSAVVNVFAEDNKSKSMDKSIEDTKDTLSEYEHVTVFSETMLYNEIANDEDYKELAKTNIEQARMGVLALNLDERGLSYIEDACLAELDTFLSDSECMLHEYTVLIPTARASTPQFYTTYKNTDFYTSLTSKSSFTVKKLNFGKYDTLVAWSQNAISLGLCFSTQLVYTLPWTLVNASLPSGYEIYTSDWTDAYITYKPTNRALYVKEGTTYKNVSNREYGDAHPYTVYHYNDVYSPTATLETSFPIRTYPDVTDSTNLSFLYVGWKIYESGANPVTYKLNNVVTLEWIED